MRIYSVISKLLLPVIASIPLYFLILDFGGTFEEITSTSYKASQYNHITGECVKKPLSQRWHKFNNVMKVQRDLYSAFLLMNSNEDKKTPSQDKCLKTFDKFLEIHNEEIKRIVNNKISIKNSGIKF